MIDKKLLSILVCPVTKAPLEYDEEKDLEFFEGEPVSIVRIPPGSFAVFLPTDAHLPLIGDGPIHKVVVKVAIGSS